MNFDYSRHKSYKFYYLGKPTAKILSHIVYDMKCKGRENIPKEGPFIIASNHISFSDPALIVANCPRTVHFMAKSELFKRKPIAVFMRNMNAFPVKRNYSDRNAIRYAKSVIDKGWVLGIFPEGRRVKETPWPAEAKAGVAYLAKATGADVLPVCIYRNPEDKRKRHSLSLVFGKVIKNSDLGFGTSNKSEEINFAAQKIMTAIKKMWEEENCR